MTNQQIEKITKYLSEILLIVQSKPKKYLFMIGVFESSYSDNGYSCQVYAYNQDFVNGSKTKQKCYFLGINVVDGKLVSEEI